MSVLASLACFFLMGVQAPLQSPDLISTYQLGPEDVINVTVLRHAEFSSDFIVPPNGTLDMPFGGTVKVTGLTVSELAAQLTNMLKSRLLKPEVSVSVKSMRIKRFYVVGDVKLSGIYDLKPGWGISESLSAAGGLNTDVQQRDVQVTLRHVATGKEIVMPLDQALIHPENPDLKIDSGDVLRMDAVQTFPIYIAGKVKAPGMYRMRVDSTGLLAAITQAGGPTDDGTMKKVRIIHTDGTEEVADLSPIFVKGNSAKLPTVRSGDMIIIPELLEKFAVLGYVMKPGFYPMLDAQTYTLADAISLSGGAAPRGRLARIGLLRMVNGVQDKKLYDLGKFLHKGDTLQNPTLEAGDVVYVPETNKVDATAIFTALTASALVFYYSKQ
jgi:polysaccharide export outer membrane protein